MKYADFLAGKRRQPPSSGITVHPDELLNADHMFPFQRQITAWSVGRGRAAVWADTGLGKTRIEVGWLDQLLAAEGGRGLIMGPLGVAKQTIREAARMGVEVSYVHDDTEVRKLISKRSGAGPQIAFCNYDRLHLLDTSRFAAVALDESSILKAFSGTTKRALVSGFAQTPFRLSASATPAPNDIEELTNHADFLGIMSSQEMRSTFFIADSRGEFMKYRLKGHAQTAFYEWLATWAIACRHPRDLGFEQDGYDLPPLSIHDHLVPTGWTAEGELFTPRLEGITQRAQVRKDTLEQRVATAIELACSEPDRQWLVWTGRNDESAAMASGLADALPNATVAEVVGSDDPDLKADTLAAFGDGQVQILVTKPTIAGYGLNFQSCDRQVFVGLSDSYEQYYQAIRRSWRFGQANPVDVHIVLADVERTIIDNVRAKEATARSTTDGLIAAISAENRRELYAGTSKADSYEPTRPLTLPTWLRSAAA